MVQKENFFPVSTHVTENISHRKKRNAFKVMRDIYSAVETQECAIAFAYCVLYM